VKFGVIVDVEASRANRQAEVGAAKTMIERTEERFGLKPERLAADTAYGAAPMLNWLVEEKSIAPHIPVNESAASSFQIGVSRGRRMASSGRLARVSHRLHMTSNQP
jgi:hypothetical protein